MRSKGANGVGRISIDFEVANYGDMEMAQRGLLKPDQVRRQTVKGVVHSGAARFVLPQAVVQGERTFNLAWIHGLRRSPPRPPTPSATQLL